MTTNMIFNKRLPVLAILIAFNLHAETTSPPEAAFCAACHGANGNSENPMVPTLAGQPYTLIEDSLLAFRAGGRACAPERADQSPVAALAQGMCATVANLDDQQIAALAAYFEHQSFVPAVQDYDQDLAASGAEVHSSNRCEQCHSDGGRTTNAMAPILAGQWTPYLCRTLKALREGSRQGPKEMIVAISALEDAEIEALLNFYASRGRAD